MFRLLSILFISLVLAFRPLIPILDYVVNYQYIVEELCENREKPEMLCNGKCYLAKEMAKTAEESQPSKDNTKIAIVKLVDVFISEKQIRFIKTNEFTFEEKVEFAYQNLYSFYYTSKPIKPPIV